MDSGQKTLKDACQFCLANQDDPKDKSLEKVCKPSADGATADVVAQKDTMLSFLKKGD